MSGRRLPSSRHFAVKLNFSSALKRIFQSKIFLPRNDAFMYMVLHASFAEELL